MRTVEPLSICNCFAIRQAARYVTQFYERELAPLGLRVTQFSILVAVNELGPVTINALAGNLYTATSQLMTDAVYAFYNEGSGRPHFFTSNNLALPTERFRALGGFDSTFPLPASEDREFCERWLHHGYQMTYAPEAVVQHAHKLTFRGFFKHYFDYGRGALHFHHVRSRAGKERLKLDPKFYFNLFTYPFRHIGGRQAILFEVMLVLAYIAYTGGFLCQKLKYRAGVGLESGFDRSQGPRGPRFSPRP